MPTDNLQAPTQTLHFFMPELIYVVAEGEATDTAPPAPAANASVAAPNQESKAAPGPASAQPVVEGAPISSAPAATAAQARQMAEGVLPSLPGGFLVLVQQATPAALSAEAEAMLRNLAGQKALNFPPQSFLLLQQPFAGLGKDDLLATGAAIVLCMGFAPKALTNVGLGTPLSSMALLGGLAVGLPHPEVLQTQKESKQRLWAWLQPFIKA